MKTLEQRYKEALDRAERNWHDHRRFCKTETCPMRVHQTLDEYLNLFRKKAEKRVGEIEGEIGTKVAEA